MRNLLLLFLVLAGTSSLIAQGVTTSSMRGQVKGDNGEALIAVNVSAKHTPSGTLYGAITDENGYYRLDNMRVGGPYELTISYVGYEDVIFTEIYLRLGETFRQNVELGESSELLDEVTIVAKAGSVGTNSGSSTQISTEDIEQMPTLNRDLDDYLRMTPQASGFGGGTSFAGVNNRYNAIYIDGAVNNDVFGLASSGTNGGQTGIAPFSIDIIDQLQVVLSPYDVTLGGFAGGGVNAVTKSGTNEMAGSAYYFLQNQSLVGKTSGKEVERTGAERTRVADFTKSTYGASLGGPIAKDKAFFFVNAEFQKDETPRPFNPSIYTSEANRSQVADLNNLSSFLQNTYGYDPGTFGDTSDELEGLKLFGKIDINLNENNKLTIRHQYTKAEEFDRNSGSSNTINFSNNGVYFPSTTNSSAIELNTSIGNGMSNNLIIGYTNVDDDRGSLGSDFPYVIVGDAGGTIEFGTEPFSTGNILKQKIFTLTDNFKMYKGKHTWTIGTHNEFYDIFNLFLPWNFGQYEFDSVDDFINGNPAAAYQRVYSLVDGITGDGSAAAAEFKAMQLGIYAQDQIQVNDQLSITAGLRLDMPILTDDPAEAPRFNDEVLPRLASAGYDIANDVQAGQAPSGQLMISPRLGFEYLIEEDRSSVLRGGIGIFTSRIPFVWPGAMYNNNGLTSTFLGDFAIPGDVNFIANIQDQYTYENPTVPSGDMNLFTNNFKYPQVLRGNLAWDKEFGDGWFTTFEALYTKTLNNIVYTNINTSTEVDFNWTGSGDTRPIYVRSEIDQDDFGAVYVASNTSEGYAYNLTASVAKRFDFGLTANLAYSYNDAEAVNEGTSSQNSSQWRGQVHIDGRNNPLLGRSDFAVGHRFISSLDYRINWNNNVKTSITLFYEGQSGQAFSYVIGGRNARNLSNQRGSTSRNRSLVYVPTDASDINLVDLTLSDGSVLTAAEQWESLNALIEEDSGLSSRRGDYVEKNGSRAPWNNRFDLAIRQDFGTNLGGNDHRFQISLDIFNIANLINKDWGVRYNVPGDFNNYFLYDFEGYEADGTTPQFTYTDEDLGSDRFDISSLSSRWSARLGLRYIFGDY